MWSVWYFPNFNAYAGFDKYFLVLVIDSSLKINFYLKDYHEKNLDKEIAWFELFVSSFNINLWYLIIILIIINIKII